MFNFCTLCGGSLELKQIPSEDRPRLVCSACGHVHYQNPKVVSGTLPVRAVRSGYSGAELSHALATGLTRRASRNR